MVVISGTGRTNIFIFIVYLLNEYISNILQKNEIGDIIEDFDILYDVF